jgi:F-type H+-transporting ATPase subunit gamma
VPSLIAIKARLKAVENIRKITRAMELVAAAKFKRSEGRAKSSRPFSDEFDDILRALAGAAQGPVKGVRADSTVELAFEEGAPPIEIETARIFEQPDEPEPRRPGLVLVTSDRGMCGAFNTKLIRAALEFAKNRPQTDVRLVPIGRKGYRFFRNRKFPIPFHEEKVGDQLELAEVRRITQKLVELFITGEVDALYLIYAQFETIVTSRVRIDKFLSIPRLEHDEQQGAYILEPDRRSVYEKLLPLYATTKIYAALADSFASEYSARMTAMQSATKNAEEMIGSLVVERNRLRQAVITKELSDIVGAAEALR